MSDNRTYRVFYPGAGPYRDIEVTGWMTDDEQRAIEDRFMVNLYRLADNVTAEFLSDDA